MSMRTWNQQLFFEAMPGRYRPLDAWTEDLAREGIDLIVCLAPDDEVRKKSPAYAELRERNPDGIEIASGTGTRTVPSVSFPIPDYGVPSADQIPAFWDLASRVARVLHERGRVFIHCGAGIGRTGTLATAALIAMGRPTDEARAEIAATGSYPETDGQKALIEAGHPIV